MKAIRVLIIVALVVLALGQTSGVSAAFSFSSGIRVFNLSSTETANVTLTFFNLAGSQNTTAGAPVLPNTSVSFFPLTQVASPFNGSVIVSSNTPIASTSNLHGFIGTTMSAAGAYSAKSTGSPTVFLPNLMKNNSGYNTWFNVQNAGGGPATVVVEYTDGTSQNGTITTPGAAITFNQGSESHNSATFAAKISNPTTNQNLVVTYVQESTTQIFASNGYYPTDYSKNPVMPLINENNGGFVTGMQIQNAGTVATDVTVTYTPRLTGGAGTACTETHTINPGQNVGFARVAFSGPVGASPIAGSTCARGVKFIGNARVTTNSTNQDLVASVNMFVGTQRGAAYNGVNPAKGTAKVLLPLVMDRNGAFFTGFNIQNVGSNTTRVTCTFTGSSYVFAADVAAGDTIGELQSEKFTPGYVGSGTCLATGTGDNKIVGTVNTNNTNTAIDLFMSYNAINVTP